jgi:SAM-dependent methyltransferase
MSMNIDVLSRDMDPMGAAIAEFHRQGRAAKLIVHSSQFDDDEIPVKTLFRNLQRMPALEKEALKMAAGDVLDVGGGSGCHSLALQEMGLNVTAIDVSPLSVETMRERGVKDARLVNLFDPTFAGQFDTILMLMNGSGIIGRIANMGEFFIRMKQLLRPGGSILMDSSDLKYLFEEEDGSFLIDIAGDYYGEVDFAMEYRSVKGESFDWLYVDFQTLSLYAAEYGFKAELVKEGRHYDYLARLTSLRSAN